MSFRPVDIKEIENLVIYFLILLALFYFTYIFNLRGSPKCWCGDARALPYDFSANQTLRVDASTWMGGAAQTTSVRRGSRAASDDGQDRVVPGIERGSATCKPLVSWALYYLQAPFVILAEGSAAYRYCYQRYGQILDCTAYYLFLYFFFLLGHTCTEGLHLALCCWGSSPDWHKHGKYLYLLYYFSEPPLSVFNRKSKWPLFKVVFKKPVY